MARKATPIPHLWIADTVRPHHANTFVEEWFRHTDETGAMGDAFDATGLIKWPYSDEFNETPEQARYHAIEDEIFDRVQAAIRPTLMQAFTSIAIEVLDREAAKQGRVRKD